MKVNNFGKFKWLPGVIYCVFAFIIILTCSSLHGQTLYFIHSGPTNMPESFQIPYETRIYSFDEAKKELTQIWTLGKEKEAGKIAVYPNPGVVLIGGDRHNPKELYVFNMNEISRPNIIKPGENIRMVDFHYYQAKEGGDKIEIVYLDKGSSYPQKKALYSAEGASVPQSARDSRRAGEIRLCGGSPRGCNEFDLIVFRSFPIENASVLNPNYEFEMNPIPDSIIQLSTSNGGALIVNEPDFSALSSASEKYDRLWMEVLIYNRLESKWNSVLIKGESESLRLVNNWLVGEITNYRQKTEERKLLTPIEGELTTGDAVLINPIENRLITTHLGFGGLILWVEDNIVYYKTVDRENAYLYKARIENGGLIGAELLSMDPVVRYFRWAFRGQAGE